MSAEPFIGVEWGTTRLRARLFDRDGRTLGAHEEHIRLSDLDRAGIAERVGGLRARWPDSIGPILLSGMIGSAMGWQEVSRVDCPAGPDAIAAGALRSSIGGHDVVFLPGLACRSRFDDPDVLRGEEVAAVGALAEAGSRAGLMLSVPGMHGKWLTHVGGKIAHFHTSMTVELYRVLAERSILAPLMAATPHDDEAFRTGVVRGAEGGGLGRLLFTARSAVQAGEMDAGDAVSFLWGVLIGADVRENLPLPADATCLVVGESEIAALFAAAIRHLGGKAEVGDADQLTATGFRHLAALTRTRGVSA